MKKNILNKIIISLNRMIGQYNTKLINHHSYVAHLAYEIAKEMHLDDKQIQDLVIAASLHDIGLLSFSEQDNFYILEERYSSTHSLTMFILVREIPYFYNSALIVRHHHVNYDEIEKYKSQIDDESKLDIPIGSFILRLADRISVSIMYNKPILEQVENNIKDFINQTKSVFHYEVLNALESLYRKDYIWLEMSLSSPEQLLIKTLNKSIKNLPQSDFFKELAKVIGHLIDFKSPYTAGHSNGVKATSQWIAENSKIKFTCDCDLNLLGLLHDIGKLAISVDILEKPGKLSPFEWNIMRAHAYYSHFALEPLYEIYPFLKNAPLHHEKLDGTGYPFGLTEETLEPCAKIIAVSDIFTAITEDRPYRKEIARNEVTKIMKTMADAGKIDKDITDLLLSHYNEVYECKKEVEEISRKKYNEFREKIHQIQSLET